MKPVVTVVIPLYNKEKTILRTLNSVLNQSEQNFKLIVVNDGSTDNSASIVESIDLDERLILINQKNTGESSARNRGVKEADTELVAFLDADDEWKPEFLEAILELASRYPDADVYGASYFVQNENGETSLSGCYSFFGDGWSGVISNYFDLIQTAFPFNASSVAVRKKALENIGGFPEGVRYGGDVDVWFRLFLTSKFAFINKPLAVYHLDAENRACVLYQDTLDEYYPVKNLNQLLKAGALPENIRQSVVEYIAQSQLLRAENNIRQGNNMNARRLIFSCRGTRKYNKRWYFLLFCAYVPPIIIMRMLGLRRHIRKFLAGLFFHDKKR